MVRRTSRVLTGGNLWLRIRAYCRSLTGVLSCSRCTPCSHSQRMVKFMNPLSNNSKIVDPLIIDLIANQVILELMHAIHRFSVWLRRIKQWTRQLGRRRCSTRIKQWTRWSWSCTTFGTHLIAKDEVSLNISIQCLLSEHDIQGPKPFLWRHEGLITQEFNIGLHYQLIKFKLRQLKSQ